MLYLKIISHNAQKIITNICITLKCVNKNCDLFATIHVGDKRGKSLWDMGEEEVN